MELFYREKGEPGLPPLVILHGLWGASENWLPVANRLAEEFHVFLPDFRNHGRSPHDARHDYGALCEDICGFIESLRLPEAPFVAGHSMGGRVVMQLLLERTVTVAGAAVIDICPESRAAGDALHGRLAEFMCAFPIEAFKERRALAEAVAEAFPREEERQVVLKNIRREGEGFGWKVNAQALKEALPALLHPALSEGLSPYPAPVLFVRGGRSEYVPEALGEGTLRLFPEARLETIAEAGHRVHAEEPETLARVLHDFFHSFFIPLRGNHF